MKNRTTDESDNGTNKKKQSKDNMVSICCAESNTQNSTIELLYNDQSNIYDKKRLEVLNLIKN